MIRVALGDLMARRVPSIDPSKHPHETFTLWSIPSFDAGAPEVREGAEIGSAKKLVQPGDVLLSRIVPHIRRAWTVRPSNGHRQIASGEWIIFRDERFLPDFVRHFLVTDHFHQQFMGTIAGVGGSLLRAQPASVARIEIPLPPLEEQRRIVAVLDRAASIRRRADTARQQARALIPALFLDLFGDPATNPKGWPRDKFEDVAEDVTRHVPKIMRREYQPTGRFPIYDQGQTEIAGYTDEPSQTTEIGSELLLFGDHTRVFRLVSGRFARGADGVRIFCFKRRLKPMFGRTFLELHGLPDAGYSRHYKFLKEVEMMVPPLPLQTAFAEQAARIESLARALDAAATKAESLAASLSAEIFG